jgi:hypothetical protein
VPSKASLTPPVVKHLSPLGALSGTTRRTHEALHCLSIGFFGVFEIYKDPIVEKLVPDLNLINSTTLESRYSAVAPLVEYRQYSALGCSTAFFQPVHHIRIWGYRFFVSFQWLISHPNYSSNELAKTIELKFTDCSEQNYPYTLMDKFIEAGSSPITLQMVYLLLVVI